ncbi:MAG: sensor histidine kinase, partial [Hyphomicrobiales bacterium]|nr:sensor histidine kinase [Hyphomicrobiales bacterium]
MGVSGQLVALANATSADDIRVLSRNELARLRVRDHGIGIPEADLPKLFNRFYRASNVSDRRYPGMGLGLF